MMDREKAIKWLEYDYFPRVGAYRKDCKQGCDACMAIHDGDDYCDIDMLWKILSLLEEQEAVVQCKDCKHIGDMYKCPVFYAKEKQPDNWFCADGEFDEDDKDINVLSKGVCPDDRPRKDNELS